MFWLFQPLVELRRGRGSGRGAGDQVGTLPHTQQLGKPLPTPHPNREGRPLTSRDPKLGAGRAPFRPWVGLGSGGPSPTHWVLCRQGSRPQTPNQAGRSRQSCRVHLSLPVASWPPPAWTPNFSEQALRRCGKAVSCWESQPLLLSNAAWSPLLNESGHRQLGSLLSLPLHLGVKAKSRLEMSLLWLALS